MAGCADVVGKGSEKLSLPYTWLGTREAGEFVVRVVGNAAKQSVEKIGKLRK